MINNSKLEAVQDMLAACDWDPVASLDVSPLPPEATRAVRILDRVTKRILRNGWVVNTVIKELPRDTSNRIPIPGDTLYLETTDSKLHLKTTGDFVYDLDNNTYVFDEPVEFEIYSYLDYNEIFDVDLQDYILYTAMVEYIPKELGAGTDVSVYLMNAQQARESAEYLRTQNANANMLRDSRYTSYILTRNKIN